MSHDSHSKSSVDISSSPSFDAMLEVMPDAVVIVNRGGEITQINHQAEVLFGYTHQELIGQPLETLLPERFRGAHGRHQSGYFATPRVRPMGVGLELFGRRKNGVEFAVEISLSPITLDGAPQVISTIRDVTERKRLERRTHDALDALLHMAEMLVQAPLEPQDHEHPARAMRGLAQLSRQVLSARRIAILSVEPDHGVVRGLALAGTTAEEEHAWAASWSRPNRFNKTFKARMFPRLLQGAEIVFDLTQSPFADPIAFQPWLAEAPQRALLAPMQVGGRLVGVFVAQAGDAHHAFTAEELSLVNATARLAGMLIDRERLLRDRQAYREAEARRALLQTIIDELPSGVYLVRGRDARLVLANRAAVDVWGGSWPVGMPMVEFLRQVGTRIFRGDGRPLPDEELVTLRAAREGATIRHQQEIFRRADGSMLPVLMSAVALDPSLVTGHSADPESGALVVLQDVTALKEAEQLKDEFIAIATHELRNPAAVLKGYASMLGRALARQAQPDEWQREAIDAIDGATKQLVELTDELLDVTRLQAGRLELRRDLRDLVEIAQRVAARFQTTTTNHAIQVTSAAEHLIVKIDQQRIEQVFGNLIANAIKYSPEGGPITITLERDTARHEAVVSVRDTGIGIPAAQAGRMFNRFTRADNAKAIGIEGTGLGLYLCREFVERHSGRIWFTSVEGEGSTFTFSLPLSAEDDALL